MSHPSKAKGYALEVAACKALQAVFPHLRRTGSVAYLKDAPDLVQESGLSSAAGALRLVVTRDKNRPMLVSLAVDDFVWLATTPDAWLAGIHVVVQVKKRERTWLGTVYDALKRATS